MLFTDDNLKKLKELRYRGVDYIQSRNLEALIARMEAAEACADHLSSIICSYRNEDLGGWEISVAEKACTTWRKAAGNRLANVRASLRLDYP